jgi:hypothetical protein
MGFRTGSGSGAHDVRRVRNRWAHEPDSMAGPMTIAEARVRIQEFLSWLPAEWD